MTLSLGGLAELVGSEMDIPPSDLLTHSFEELGFDSLRMLELDLVVEEVAALLPEEAFFSMRSLHDTYESYVAVMGANHPGRENQGLDRE